MSRRRLLCVLYGRGRYGRCSGPRGTSCRSAFFAAPARFGLCKVLWGAGVLVVLGGLRGVKVVWQGRARPKSRRVGQRQAQSQKRAPLPAHRHRRLQLQAGLVCCRLAGATAPAWVCGVSERVQRPGAGRGAASKRCREFEGWPSGGSLKGGYPLHVAKPGKALFIPYNSGLCKEGRRFTAPWCIRPRSRPGALCIKANYTARAFVGDVADK